MKPTQNSLPFLEQVLIGAPVTANLEPTVAAYPAVERVATLLSDPNIMSLPSEEQGKRIVDNVIGEIIALGDQETSSGARKSSYQTLEDMSRAMRDGALATGTDTERNVKWEIAKSQVTRTGGARELVEMLANDVRTAQPVMDMLSSVEKDVVGNLTMTSIQQVEGYIDAKSADSKNPDTSWQSIIKDEVKGYVSGKDKFTRWTLGSSAKSTDPKTRNYQLAWDRAAQTAGGEGIDVPMIARSGELMQKRREAGKHVGHYVVRGNFEDYRSM
ncbi:hypothetical protein H7171_00790 [Candidatus Saccharibacteria bacterium]|nr:hypothetical protein [Candidatus Saccharibacteria bacterium]